MRANEFLKRGVAEGSENNNVTAQKIFFARSNIAPKGWSYDHVGFITQDGKQIQMSGHKGNDVYVTNDVTDDPEFPKQNIKIVSLSKPVSVPTTNSIGAENCGTFVANVLQANGVKGIDTQKIYSVFKKPQEQGVAEDSEQKNTNDLNEKWSQKYKRSIDCSHPKGFSQRAHCQGRKKNEDTLSEKKRRKAKAKRVYGGYAFYPIATVDSGEGGDGGGLEEGWKEKLAAAGAAGAMALGGYNYVKQPTQTTQQPQPTAQAQQKTIKPITQKPLEKILYTHAVKAGLSGDELAQFMAQCAHETNDWNSLVEYGGSLDFRKYDPKFAPKKAKILGNTKIGDGARYKGRGYIQLTGRYNYTKASKALGIDLVNKPELAQHPDTAAEIALLFWKNRVRPNVDDFQNTTQVTKKINSGLRGLEDRHENYQDYLRGSGNNKK
jgi:putative chitinase